MRNPTNVYGDVRVPAKVVTGRPTFRFAIGDSVINGWYATFCAQMPGLVGYGDIIAHMGPPVPTGGAHINGFWYYFYRATTGTAVVRGAHGIGATTINIYNAAGGLLPAGNGYPAAGMTVTLDVSSQTETGRIANTYAQNGALNSNPLNTASIPLAAATTKTHADGTLITWTRPSVERAYSMKSLYEVLFATGASPGATDNVWNSNRLADFTTLGDASSYGDAIEQKYLHDGNSLNSGAVNCIMFYLALPVNNGAPNLRLRSRSAEAAPVETTVDFSIYNATPMIKAVTLAVPAPAAYDPTKGIRFVVNSPNAGSFTAGQVFVCLGFVVVKSGATTGIVLDAHSEAGMQVQDLANDAGSFGSIWSPAYQIQYAAAVRTTVLGNIDVYTVHLGMNNCPTPAAALVAFLQTIDANMSAAEPTAGLEYCTPYDTNNNTASGASARMSAACVSLGVGSGNVCYDMVTQCGAATFVTVRELSDGTHPINPGGYEWFAANYLAMIKACDSVVKSGGSDAQGRFPQVGF